MELALYKSVFRPKRPDLDGIGKLALFSPSQWSFWSPKTKKYLQNWPSFRHLKVIFQEKVLVLYGCNVCPKYDHRIASVDAIVYERVKIDQIADFLPTGYQKVDSDIQPYDNGYC